MMKYYPDLSRGHSVDDSCGQELMCGMPFYYPALRLLRLSMDFDSFIICHNKHLALLRIHLIIGNPCMCVVQNHVFICLPN